MKKKYKNLEVLVSSDTVCSHCNRGLDGYPGVILNKIHLCFSCAKVFENTIFEENKVLESNVLEIEKEAEIWIKLEQKSINESVSFRAQCTWEKAIYISVAILGSFSIGALAHLFSLNILYFTAIVFTSFIFLKYLKFDPSTIANDLAIKKWQENNVSKILKIRELRASISRIDLSYLKYRRGKISQNYRTIILERDDYQCQSCMRVFSSKELEVHHVKPRSQGGKDYHSNLVTLCFKCHLNEKWFGHHHYLS